MPPSIPSKPSGLCRCCAGFYINKFSADSHGECPLNLADMMSGMKQGCELCSMLHSELKGQLHQMNQEGCDWSSWYVRLSVNGDKSDLKKHFEYNKLRAIISPYPSLSVEEIETGIPLRILENQSQRIEAQFYLAADPDSAAARSGTITGRFLGDDPTSEQFYMTIGRWIDDCVDKHEACVHTASGKERINPKRVLLPTRCIRVTKKKFFLQETRELHGSYIILSHRWDAETGTSSTTVSNYNARLTRNFVMPQTFLDVVEVARAAEIEFVWIDSICIIQSGDHGSDWEREATKMATYYQNALFTIAATESSRISILSKRPVASFEHLARLPYHNSEGVRRGYFYAYRPNTDERQNFHCLLKSELLRRGWVFQEWILSRRIVYYTPDQIIMECQSRPPRTENNYIITDKHDDTTVSSNFKINYELFHEKLPFARWYFIVSAYSSRSLTYPRKDRTVALSGIAQEFKNFLELKKNSTTQLQYVSGLWFQDIHHGLLWIQAKEDRVEQLSNAPSWSWTSNLGEVTWIRRAKHVHKDIEIISLILESGETCQVQGTSIIPQVLTESAHTDSRGLVALTDPYSDLRNLHAILRIRGRVQLVLVGDELQEYERMDLSSALPMDSPGHCWTVLCSPHTSSVIAGCGTFERLKVPTGKCIPALHISTEKGSIMNASWLLGIGRTVCNILLLEVNDQGQYQRVGIARIFDHGLIDRFRSAKVEEIELA